MCRQRNHQALLENEGEFTPGARAVPESAPVTSRDDRENAWVREPTVAQKFETCLTELTDEFLA